MNEHSLFSMGVRSSYNLTLTNYKQILMAKLSDFLGGLVSSISDARVNSDIQSVKIAEEYAKNDILKHFAVPRMRVDKVEINIPVAIDKMLEKSTKIYEPIDNKSFSSKAYQQILKTLNVTSLSSTESRTLKSSIAEHIQLLEAKIRVDQADNALEDFSKNIALKVVGLKSLELKDLKSKKASTVDFSKLQSSIATNLQSTLKDEIKSSAEIKKLDSLEVVVEADRLRELKPESIMMIKMTISEQGMEWVSMENKNGAVESKLMPE